jgi:polysaccharide pyruvyl transferase WcaK-like protein
MSKQMPVIHNEIKVINQSSNNVNATQSSQRIGFDHMITTVILRDSSSYGPLKQAGVIN